MHADYFQNHFARQLDEVGTTARVDIHLKDGQILHARRVDHVADAFLLLTVFPPDGIHIGSVTRRRDPQTGEVVFDRLAVSHDVISHIVISRAEPEASTTLEFVRSREHPAAG